MFPRFFTALLAISTLILSATYVSAGPGDPEILLPGPCPRDPMRRIGGVGYIKMWPANGGPGTWTSGTGANNVRWEPSTGKLWLKSGVKAGATNRFFVKIDNSATPGMATSIRGYLNNSNQMCYILIDPKMINNKTKWLLQAKKGNP